VARQKEEVTNHDYFSPSSRTTPAFLATQLHLIQIGLLKHHIQEVESSSLYNDMDAMVPGHFFPAYPPNMSQGSLESVNEAFTSTLFLVAGVLVLLFWRVPAV
jgi:hypothetical protein